MEDYSYEDFSSTLFSTNVCTRALEYRLDDRLMGLAIIDILETGISAVYTFYDPDMPGRSLGTYSILKELELTAAISPDKHLYLGFWLCGLKQMDYKRRFRPFEVYWNGKWQEISSCLGEIEQSSEMPCR